MPDSTESGPPGFPATRHSLIEALGSADPGLRLPAYDALIAGYWKPAYRYVRVVRRFEREDAEDLVQDFFSRAFERDNLTQFDPSKARFRTFLRVCLDRFAANALKAERRLKRGGGQRRISLDPADEPAMGDALASDPERFFRREWIRSLFEGALGAVGDEYRRQGKDVQLAIFMAYDVDPVDPENRPRYEDLAARFGIPVTQVTNYLAAARRAFRREALARLRTVTASAEDFAAEAKELFGVLVE